MKHSLLSALAGWAVGSLVGALIYCADEIESLGRLQRLDEFFGFAWSMAVLSLPFVLLVWLVALWPLYRGVPASSRLWNPFVCVGCGAVAGAVLFACVLRFCVGSPPSIAFSFLQLSFGAIYGAVTCAVGSRLHRGKSRAA